MPSLLGLSVGSKLTSAELAKLWSRFEADYPSEIIEVHNRPCKQLIQLVNQQKQQEDFRFIPWKQLLTEAQCDKLKLGAQKREKSFWGLLSEASGHWGLMESDPPASPFSVQRLLMSRSVAWALVGWCHLSSAKKLVGKFLDYYTRGGVAESGMRAPSLAEAY